MGIYKTECKDSNKIYIGQTKKIKKKQLKINNTVMNGTA